MEKIDKIKQGRNNRARGKKWELFVRKDLEDKGWIVCKWANNVEGGKLVSAKHKYNPFSKMLSLGAGFPDFIAFRKVECPECITPCGYKIIGVESKFGKYLDRIEKEKVKWLLENNIFDDIWVCYKGKKRGEIVYEIQS